MPPTGRRRGAISAALWLGFVGCAAPREAALPGPRGRTDFVSLLGRPLQPLSGGSSRAALEADLDAARRAVEQRPDDADALIWLGRRYGYLWRMGEAIDVFTRGVEKHPDDARFRRHRGHRHISIRRFDLAIADLREAARRMENRADEVEPDGRPNPRHIPLTTLKFNIWYHLGVAHHCRGEFDAALSAWRETGRFGRGYDDNTVAIAHWTYMALRRLGRDGEATAALAAVRPEMDIIENGAYHRLCLMYQGTVDPAALEREVRAAATASAGLTGVDGATLGFGLGHWHKCNGDRDRADELFRLVVAGDQWPAFGFIAAEAELARQQPVAAVNSRGRYP